MKTGKHKGIKSTRSVTIRTDIKAIFLAFSNSLKNNLLFREKSNISYRIHKILK